MLAFIYKHIDSLRQVRSRLVTVSFGGIPYSVIEHTCAYAWWACMTETYQAIHGTL